MKFISLALLLLVTNVFAAEIKVFDLPDTNRSQAYTQFNVNHDLNRAWVEFIVKETFSNIDRGQRGEFYREQVPGLSFDSSRGVITLDHEGQLIDCATVVRRGRFIFRHNKVTNTNCHFDTKRVKVEVDNGYEVRKERRLQVFLITQ